jgi:hypothetical protein
MNRKIYQKIEDEDERRRKKKKEGWGVGVGVGEDQITITRANTIEKTGEAENNQTLYHYAKIAIIVDGVFLGQERERMGSNGVNEKTCERRCSVRERHEKPRGKQENNKSNAIIDSGVAFTKLND